MPRTLRVPLAGCVIALSFLACGPSRPSPTGPTPATSGTVTAHVFSIPLSARRLGAPGDLAAYELAGSVTFRATAASGARLVSMELEITDEHGRRWRQQSPLAIDLAAGGEATVAWPSPVMVPDLARPTSLVIRAYGVQTAGDQLVVQSPEVPLTVTATATVTGSPAPDATFVGAGDIADCTVPGGAMTARLLQSIPGEVFALGDLVYPGGTAEAFSTCYESSWGALRGRTRPTPGNHEWDVDQGRPYFSYFGPAAGPGYYSFDLGAWHVLSLNSNVSAQPGSRQYEWARADLAAHPAACTLAYWHHPLFSSGTNGGSPQMRAMWQLLDEAGVELVMAAHDHLYERFAPQDAHGRPAHTGMREFVVGTGGAPLYGLTVIQPNSEVRNNQAWGVLKLTLRSGRYDWEFVPVSGHSFRDVGSAPCGS